MLNKILDNFTMANLWVDGRLHSFLSEFKGLKSVKIIQTARGECKLIGYFKKWDDICKALDSPVKIYDAPFR